MRSEICVAWFLMVVLAPISQATPFRLAHTFRPSTPEADNFFGSAVAIDGGVVAIKSDSGYLDGNSVSVTHLFEEQANGGWNEVASFEYDNVTGVDGNPFIGEELAIDAGVVAVGFGDTYTRGTSSRPVQVLQRDSTGWSRSYAELDRSRPIRFAGVGQRPAGRTVDVSGDFMIAEESGVRRPDGSGSGVARVFERQSDNSWLETANLFTTDRNASGAAAVAIDGDTAALVYRHSSNPTSTSRAAGIYFFERQANGEWNATEQFNQDPDENGFFFRMIDLDGDRAVARDIGRGTMSTYERVDGVWTETIGPPPTNSFRTDNGGFALEGDLLARTVIGYPFAIEVYQHDEAKGWELLTTITNPETDPASNFGSKLALSEGRLLVGSPCVGSAPSKPGGAVYLFVPVPEPSTTLLLGGGLTLAGLWRVKRQGRSRG